MQYIVYTQAGIAAVFQISNIAFDKSEVSPLIRSNQRFYLLQIVTIPRGKIIEPHDLLVQFQQRFQQIGTVKPAAPVTSQVPEWLSVKSVNR